MKNSTKLIACACAHVNRIYILHNLYTFCNLRRGKNSVEKKSCADTPSFLNFCRQNSCASLSYAVGFVRTFYPSHKTGCGATPSAITAA